MLSNTLPKKSMILYLTWRNRVTTWPSVTEEVIDQLWWKKYLAAAMEEVLDQLHGTNRPDQMLWNKYLTICDGRSTQLAIMKEVFEFLEWKMWLTRPDIMEQTYHPLWWKIYLSSYNGRSSWPAAMEEVVDQLQWKKSLTTCSGRSPWPAEMEEVVDQLQWKR